MGADGSPTFYTKLAGKPPKEVSGKIFKVYYQGGPDGFAEGDFWSSNYVTEADLTKSPYEFTKSKVKEETLYTLLEVDKEHRIESGITISNRTVGDSYLQEIMADHIVIGRKALVKLAKILKEEVIDAEAKVKAHNKYNDLFEEYVRELAAEWGVGSKTLFSIDGGGGDIYVVTGPEGEPEWRIDARRVPEEMLDGYLMVEEHDDDEYGTLTYHNVILSPPEKVMKAVHALSKFYPTHLAHYLNDFMYYPVITRNNLEGHIQIHDKIKENKDIVAMLFSMG